MSTAHPVNDEVSRRHPQTIAVHAGRPAGAPGEPLSTPPVMSSTYRAGGDVEYGRHGNPTWRAFEEAMGILDGGEAVAFSSGVAAITAVLGLVPPGAKVVAPARDVYSGTRELLEHLHERGTVDYVPVEPHDLDAVVGALEGASLLWVESPSNPLLRIADIEALAVVARSRDVLLVVDSTFATPLLSRPLALGADLVIHSATKYISGHSDILMGVAVAAREDIAERLRDARTREGAAPGPWEAFLALRGLRTLGVRLERAQHNADFLVRRLAGHPAVGSLHYPGLEEHPEHALAGRVMDGYGAMLSFEVATAEEADAICNGCALIVHTTSLGGVETTMERRTRWPADAHLPPGLIRVSVGIEDAEDLWRDLSEQLDRLSR